MSERFTITVDGRRINMICPAGTTLDQARASAICRFGAHRVGDIQHA